MVSIKNATIKDVALEAGVSQATVSYVINSSRDVNENTKKRVFNAIEKLNYKPNKYFQNLKNAKNNVIGLVVPSIDSYFFSKVVQGITDVFNIENNYCAEYSITICSSNDSISEEIKILKSLKNKVRGIIVAPTIAETPEESERRLNQSYLHNILDDKFPIIFLDRIPRGFNSEYKLVKSYKAKERVSELINYLIKMGHRKIGMISGKKLSTITSREQGYEEALMENNINLDSDLIKKGKINVNSACKMAKDLIKNQNITAIFSANDELTLGTIKAINELKLKIPEDISIVGFDDYEWTEIAGITTIKQPAYQIGKNAAFELLKILHKNADYRTYNNCLECKIQYRNSVSEGPHYKEKYRFVYIKDGIVYDHENDEIQGIVK